MQHVNVYNVNELRTLTLCNMQIDASTLTCYNKDTAREARPEGKGRRKYQERKSRTPAKTVTHFLISCMHTRSSPASSFMGCGIPVPPIS